jgi:homoaconitase/3-isopropylmalate dehydratase large subunit
VNNVRETLNEAFSMGMTITEKILASHCSQSIVKPGDVIFAKIDLALSTDIGTASSIEVFEKMGATRLFSTVEEVKGIKIDQVFMGSCVNGSLEDFRRASRILKGKKVHNSVRLIAIPGTQEIFLKMIEEGIAKIFIQAGAILGPPTCGPCLGGHMGVLAADEVALSTSNRNFVGRMGHPKSKVYLASPAVAAASAVLGQISHPKELS